jgi:hypothetical protein
MNVELYGCNHGPWVQAVLLGLHEKGIEHRMTSIPPREVLMRWGVYMPAISIDNEPWAIESAQILVKLGYEPISTEHLKAIQSTFQGVLHRADNLFDFFGAWAGAGDTSTGFFQRSVRNFLRSFIPVYVFTRRSLIKRILKPADPENFGDQYLFWESVLESSSDEFFDGDKPDIRDFQLFGIIQCHASIPVPPLESLIKDERLANMRRWIASMHERFSDYPHLYSGSYFEPRRPRPVSASLVQRLMFYFGLTTIILAFPLTLPLAFVLMRKVPH